jgi:Tfp pilus assembly protein PilX
VIVIVLAVVVMALLVLGLVFLLGFRLGGEHWQDRLSEVRLDAARAERQLHDLTRDAFVSMSEAAQRSRPSGS